MTKMRSLVWIFLLLIFSSCNLYGGLSKPSNDDQYLLAARACLDQGKYDCALENYKALSSSFNDVAISEGSLTTLAQNKIFSITDLVGSLGTSLGSSGSFSILAEALAARGITDGANRSIIKTVYDNDGSINDTKLKAFSKFIAALAMFNEVLANAVGADGKLTASDIVTAGNISSCKAGGACGGTCTAPAGTALTYNAGDATNWASTAAAWSGSPTIQKLIAAAADANNELTIFAGGNSNQGLLNSIQQLSSISGAETCSRYLLLQYLAL